MPIVVLLVVVATIGAAVVVLAGRRGGDVDFPPDRPSFVLPDRELGRQDVDGVRFAVGVRGYRMDQVDLVMDRLAAELAARDRVVAELRGEPVAQSAEGPVDGTGPVVADGAGAPAPVAADAVGSDSDRG